MIGVDTNILVYAHRRDSPWHKAARECIRRLAEGPSGWLVPWPCLHEFLAIVTHPRIYRPASSLVVALGQVDAWLASPSLTVASESPQHWSKLRDLCVMGRIDGPAVHDARVAAICLDHGVDVLWSTDRDFSRFPTIRLENPLART